METVSTKRILIFMGIAVFTAVCSGLAFFFFLTSGQTYFFIIAVLVLIVGLSNITSKILARLYRSNTGYLQVTFREPNGMSDFENSNNKKG